MPVNGDHRRGQEELAQLVSPRRQVVSLEQGQGRRDLCRTQVHPVAAPVPEGTNGLTRARDVHGKDARRMQIPRRGQLLSPTDLTVVHAHQVDRPT